MKGFCGETLRLQAAGRTDTGVHALQPGGPYRSGQGLAPRAWSRDALNAHLAPEPIAVLAARWRREDFHARFSAMARRYLYRILNRIAPPSLDKGRVWHVKKPLDVSAMARGRAVTGRPPRLHHLPRRRLPGASRR